MTGTRSCGRSVRIAALTDDCLRKAQWQGSNPLDPTGRVKITDYGIIAGYGIKSTPGLVVNEKVLLTGRVPTAANVCTSSGVVAASA